MNRIGIFGLGCIGSVLAKYLYRIENNSCFYYNRSIKNKISIFYNGNVDSISISLSEGSIKPLDWLFVCIKEYHYKGAHDSLLELIYPNTRVVLFRNGINLSDNVSSFVANENILETIIDCPTQQQIDGAYFQLRKPTIILPDTKISKEFISLFDESEIRINLSENFKIEQWKKLIESSSIGIIQVVTGKPCVIFQEERWLNVYTQLIKEGILVAKSEGVFIEDRFTLELLEKLKNYPPEKGSSMLSDKLAGREIEFNAKTGAIIKLGEINKINIPVTQSIYKTLVT